MKLISRKTAIIRPTKTVNYFNIPLLEIPDGWLAVDQDGSLYHFENEPRMDKHSEYWYDESSDRYLGEVDLEGMDWEKTKMEVVV